MGGRGRHLLREKFGFAAYITGLEVMFGRVVAESGGPVEVSRPECMTAAA